METDQLRKEIIDKTRRVIIKIGSSVLTLPKNGIDLDVFIRLTSEISALKKAGYEIIIVSSGAIAFGMDKLELSERPKSIPQKQAAAAVGQTSLMWNYEKFFGKHQEKVAQVLLTHDDLSNRRRYLNARNTLYTLIDLGILPIINENDSVVVEEIKFGDNDNLAALVTSLVEADLLLILTDIDGLYDRDPKEKKEAKLIPLVKRIDSEVEKIGCGTKSNTSVGGMSTKIQAAKKAAIFGIPTIIANGKINKVINQIFQGKQIGTLFLPQKSKLTSRKNWIAYTLRTKGTIVVDEGARRALVSQGKSLLPSGVLRSEGRFNIGDPVSCVDIKGVEFARGLVNYNYLEIEQIKGLRTNQIEAKLGYKYYDEIIHRDDLVVL